MQPMRPEDQLVVVAEHHRQRRAEAAEHRLAVRRAPGRRAVAVAPVAWPGLLARLRRAPAG